MMLTMTIVRRDNRHCIARALMVLIMAVRVTGELSAYLKHILGWGDTVRYYQENRTAKEKAFGLGGHSSSCAADARCYHDDGNGTRTTRRADDARGSGVNGHNGRGRNGNGNGGDEELMEEVVGGEDTKGFENMELWKCQRLVMADHVRSAIFSHTRLWAHADADKIHIERCVCVCVCAMRVRARARARADLTSTDLVRATR
jgi:hypothetical protein